MEERRDTSWAVKKEINYANIFVTASAIFAGVWWAAGVESQFDLNEQARLYIAESVKDNKDSIRTTNAQFKRIEEKIDLLRSDLRFFQGKSEAEHDVRASRRDEHEG